MEFLVHNISHSDLVVELSWLRAEDAERVERVPVSVLARPKFSLFQPISQQIMAQVQRLRGPQASAPMADALEAHSPERGAAKQAGLTPSLLDISESHDRRRARWKAQCRDTQCPIGFSLQDDPLPVEDLGQFQLRGACDRPCSCSCSVYGGLTLLGRRGERDDAADRDALGPRGHLSCVLPASGSAAAQVGACARRVQIAEQQADRVPH
jgi:hypothetical protein